MSRFLRNLIIVFIIVMIAIVLFLFWPIFPKSVPKADNDKPVDVLLIGGGVMSATLGTYIAELEPSWTIDMYERLDDVALESSNGWNNAGTGHSGFAEMNYTPEDKNGHVEIVKAVKVAEDFEISKQFWSYQLDKGVLTDKEKFIRAVPHMSFVWGDDNVKFLKARREAMIQSPLFYGMQYSEDAAQIKQWAPLVMDGRKLDQKIAATKMDLGADVNFGEITRQLVASLKKNDHFKLHASHEVVNLKRNDDKTWSVVVKDLKTSHEKTVKARYVFIGAGGAAVKLLQESKIPEAAYYGGFPVGGQFLVTENPALVQQHLVKVYGKAAVGSPPMSVPHVDKRFIDGKEVVLFGPFALFSSKFLKHGSWFDLLSSTNEDNVFPMMSTGAENLDLVKYLVSQVVLTDDQKFKELVQYYPQAKKEDWHLITAGQRVQIIKTTPEKGTKLEFGTEIVTSKDGTLSALLGASPGASTSPPIMLSLLEKAFPEKVKGDWNAQLHQIVPSYGQSLNKNPALLSQIRQHTSAALGLPYIELPAPMLTAKQPEAMMAH